MQLTNINGVEEVNIFKADGGVIHISAPKSKNLSGLVNFVVIFLFLFSSGFYPLEHLCYHWCFREQEVGGVVARYFESAGS